MGDREAQEADARAEPPEWWLEEPDTTHHVMIDIQWDGDAGTTIQEIEWRIEQLAAWMVERPDTFNEFITARSDTGWEQEWEKPGGVG